MEGWIIFLVYSAWAIYSGHKWLNGRREWLERKESTNKVCKVLATIACGYVIGVWTIGVWVVKLGIRVTEGFR